MTGLPSMNYLAFNEAAHTLRQRGHTVFNPAENFGGDQSRTKQEYLHASTSAISFHASNQYMQLDAAVVLPGWQRSEGSLLEMHLCQVLGVPMYSAVDGSPIDINFSNTFTEQPRPTRPLVAISGRKFSGKTTLADALAKELNLRRYGFAMPLKEGLAKLGVIVDGPEKDVEALQFIGTDYFRKRDPDWWVKTFDRATTDREETGLVIDDVRFPNELQWARDNGFITVRLSVSPNQQKERARGMGIADLRGDVFEHASETGLDGDFRYDLIFTGESTVEERVERILEELKARGFDCSDQRGRGIPDLALGQGAASGEAPQSQEPQVLAAA
jgi:hypothetical protein